MYRERPSLVPGVRCTWVRAADADDEPLIVPDGCVDVVWFDGGRLELAGPDTAGRPTALAAGTRIVGVRLAPGAAHSVLGLPISEVRDRQHQLADLDGRWRHLPETSPWSVEALEAAVARIPRTPADRVVQAAVSMLEADPGLRVRDLAARIGISTRQLNRRFDEAVGYGPKMFARVARLQRFLAIATGEAGMAARASAAGYASQSHLGDDVRALTTLTPVRLLEDRGLPTS